MSFHADRELQHRAVLHARQDTRTDTSSRARPITRLSTSSSSRTTAISISTAISSRPTSTSSRPATSSSLVSTSSISTSRAIINTSPAIKIIPTTTSSTSSVSSPVATSAAAAAGTSSTRKGSLAGIIIGTLVGIVFLIIITAFIIRRLRKRRNRLDDARFFNKDKLERPGMVQGIAAGPGVGSLNGSIHEKDSQPLTIEKNLPSSPYPFDTPQGQTLHPSPYGAGNPFSPFHHSGSQYTFNESQHELGAPPMPGNNSPAPYSPYMATFSQYAHPNQSTPPGSPFIGGDYLQNPFATPSHPSTPSSAAGWPNTPMGAYHLPLLPGGVFSNDSYRDSGYSAGYSDVQVGQAYKVQVGRSMPKYEDLTITTTATTKDAPESPAPLITSFDPAASVDAANTGPTTMVDDTTTTPTSSSRKSLPPRPVSTHTIYNPEDAYGGV